MYFEGTKNNVYVEVALQHNDSYNESVFSFVNNINTPEGGTHLVGFRNALTKTFNDYARSNKLLKDNEPNLSGDDIREGLTAIISVKIEDPQFEGQTKAEAGKLRGEKRCGQRGERTADVFSGAEPVRCKDDCRKVRSGAACKGSGKKGAGSDETKDCAGRYSPARQAGRLLG